MTDKAPACDPLSFGDYSRKQKNNERIFGFGLSTSISMPCPGCAEPDFLKTRVLDVQEALAGGAKCEKCGRSFRAKFVRTPAFVEFEIVQTSGPALPPYLPPIKRIEV